MQDFRELLFSCLHLPDVLPDSATYPVTFSILSLMVGEILGRLSRPSAPHLKLKSLHVFQFWVMSTWSFHFGPLGIVSP